MTDKKYPSNLYLESAATNVDFAKKVSVEAVVVMARELLALRKVHEGWKLVPVEPTIEMLDSQEHEMLPMVHHDSMLKRARMIRRHGWRVMLAAAPEPQ